MRNIRYGKKSMALVALLLLIGVSFAANVIGDVPSSEADLRKIVEEDTLYDGADVDIEQGLAFYDGSPVYLRIAQPKGPVSYVYDKTETFVRIYGGDLFDGDMKFPYVSNFIPSSTIETVTNLILSVEITGAVFLAQEDTERGEIAGQIVSRNMERSFLISSSDAATPLDYYYKRANDFSEHTDSIKGFINPTLTPKVALTDYYVARCGDGVIDVAEGDSDGNGGIETEKRSFLERHPRSVIPEEECDDGNTEDGDECSSTCKLEETPDPICESLVADPTEADETIEEFNFTCTSKYASSITLTITDQTGEEFYTDTYEGNTNTWTLDTLPAGENTISCVAINDEGTEAVCTDTSVTMTPTVYIAPTCNITATDAEGNTINSNVLPGADVDFDCELTNEAVLATDPYMFGIKLNGSNMFTPVYQSQNTFSQTFDANGAVTAICTIKGFDGDIGTCTTSFNVVAQEPMLKITKTIVPSSSNPDGKYKPGDVVTFRIDFSNTGSGTARNVRVRDIFPLALEYNALATTVFGIDGTYLHGTYPNGNHTIIEYSGFNMAPGTAGYFITKGIVKSYDFADQTSNHAYIIGDNADQAEAHIMFNYDDPNADVTITKTASTSQIYLGNTIGFTVTIKNNGDTINNLQINDIWPEKACITPDTNVTSNMALQANGDLAWILPGAFPAGQTLTLKLTGHVVDADACAAVSPFTNTATYKYSLAGIEHIAQASVTFDVLPTPYANIDFQKTILQAGNSQGDVISYKLSYTNNGTDTLGGFVVTDYRPATLEFISASWLPITTQGCTNGCDLTFQIPGTLEVGATASLILTGKIK